MRLRIFLFLLVTVLYDVGARIDGPMVFDKGVRPLQSVEKAGSLVVGSGVPDWSDVILDGKHRYIETLLAVDGGITRYYAKDEQKIKNAVISMIHVVNQFLAQLDVKLIIVGIVPVNGYELSLDQFKMWREEQNNLPPHDIAMMLRFRFEGGVAFVDGACSGNSVGVTGFFPEAPYEYASIFVHEVAHLVGLAHNFQRHCNCRSRSKKCLEIEGFEECSVQAFADILYSKHCIQELPTLFPHSSVSVCGNGVVEAGEECDCGPKKYCKNPLCDPRSCKYVTNKVYLYIIAGVLCLLLVCFMGCFIKCLCNKCMRKKLHNTDELTCSTPQRCLVSPDPSPELKMPSPITKSVSTQSTETLLECALPSITVGHLTTTPKRRAMTLDVPVPLGEDMVHTSGYVKMHPPRRLFSTESERNDFDRLPPLSNCSSRSSSGGLPPMRLAPPPPPPQRRIDGNTQPRGIRPKCIFPAITSVSGNLTEAQIADLKSLPDIRFYDRPFSGSHDDDF